MYSPECDSDQDTQGTASPDDGIDSMSQLQSAQNNKLDDALGLNPTSNRLAPSQLDQHEGHGLTSASALRKVSEQLLSTSRTRASLSAPLTPRPLAPAPEARPSSIALPPGALARQPGPPRCLSHPHKPAINCHFPLLSTSTFLHQTFFQLGPLLLILQPRIFPSPIPGSDQNFTNNFH